MNPLDSLYSGLPEAYASGVNGSGSYGFRMPIGPLTIRADGYYDSQNNRFTEYEIMRAIQFMGGDLSAGVRGPINGAGPSEYLFSYNRRF